MRSLRSRLRAMRSAAHRRQVREMLVEPRQHGGGVAGEPDLGRANPVELLGIDVDLDQRELVVGAPVRELKLQPRADRKHHVGLRPQRMAARQRMAERMAIVEHAASAAIGHDRRTKPLGERAHLVGGIERAAADEDHRTIRPRQHRGGALDRILVERRLGIGRQGRRQLDLGARRQHVGRDFHADRPRPSRVQCLEGAGDDIGRLLRAADTLGPFGQFAQDADLVGNFVQEPVPLADAAARDLADQREHARAGRIGGGERGGAVEKAGPRHHRVGGGLSGRQRGAERHIGGALLVPGMHDRERVAGVEHGVEQMIALDAGQAIDRGDAVREHRAHDGITSTHQRHAGLLIEVAAPSFRGRAQRGARNP